MPPPLPIPSKAAIHALRGIALGTSCAIGVIVEDRRRRISTLKTAVSNKEKLKSVKRYHHGMAVPSPVQFDEATFIDGDQFQWHQVEDDIARTDDGPRPRPRPRQHSSEDGSPEAKPSAPLKSGDILESSSITTTQTETSPPKLLQHGAVHPLDSAPRLAGFPEMEFDAHKTWGIYQPTSPTSPTPIIKSRLNKRAQAVANITSILGSKDEERLDRALKKFSEACLSCYSQHLDEEWIALSIRLSKDCHAKGRLEDAAKLLISLTSAGPLEESQYYAHQPILLINHYLRQADENGHLPEEAISAATRIFLAEFKEKPQVHFEELDDFGKHLMAQNLISGEFRAAHNIYWRVIGVAKDAAEFIGWAIEKLHEHRDHKSVLKYFLLNYSKTSPDIRSYHATVDCAVSSVEALKGLKAEHVIDAIYRMGCPDEDFIQTRWVMKLLQAHWDRNQDFPTLKALFDGMLSLGLLDKVTHPQGVYRTIVELSIKAEEYDLARSYYEELLGKYPEMASDVALRGHMTLPMAKAGDWDGVFNAFVEMQALKDGQETRYDNAFVSILKIFSESHPAAEVRELVSKYTSVLGVRMHRYLVTIVANKYGQCRDAEGFVSWLRYCGEVGFALDSSFCNSLLHNCRTKWAMPYHELRALCSEFKKIDASLVDNTTQRILSQAALRAGKTARDGGVNRALYPSHIAVDKFAYAGKTADRRDIYEAMNQEISNNKPATAVSIYQRAIKFGMPPCPHCLRLAILATLKSSNNASASAMKLIHFAHRRGEDVTSAVSVFIKYQLDNLQAGSAEVLLHMRNLITQFEALHIIIAPDVLTHMAMFCVKLGHYEKAVSLCNLAVDKSGTGNQCFSRQCFRVLLMSYPKLLDLKGIERLIEDLLKSEYDADGAVYLYLKATTRLIKKMDPDPTVDAIVNVLEHAKEEMARRRGETREGGRYIAKEVLKIMNEALADMLASESGKDLERQQWQ
ncbi:hypothetical protein F5Y00DRAFT_227359 [Daldinia vernicosa]|uniref:uncharacterized protein n=1 Tax=Daldinia vernicosa TaxID=114800 RepID=UPI0020073182|nr:uncharacterized protein F5Y00DRAFT_227359 [Daldinia vernicosa]KAI0852702.1 hypothetical protein F5Y00DRAFT_227359 [Daldinia vernicosa]